MSAGEEETKAQELVIIRRPIGGEEGGHKGGVWKIAYADFMTAMMAFFLVMWLINATDKQTITQVATYFNPLRLTDKVALSKGMHADDAATQSSGNPEQSSHPTKDANEKGHASAKQQPSKDDGHGTASGTRPKYTEEALFRDPYGVLSRLAEEAVADQSRRANGGDGLRDPFDPAFRRETHAEKHDVAKGTALPPGELPPSGQKKSKAPSTPPPPIAEHARAPAEHKQPAEVKTPPSPPPPAKSVEEGRVEKAAKAARKAAEQAATHAEAARLQADIRAVVARAIAGALPNITVTVTDEGLLISLTDDQNFGMFAIASAEPRPAMVVLMEKLGKVIVGFPEPLVVRGHTDGRPYRSGTYDNWRLSTARAHMAYYMLVRAGIPESPFERIEGHADRNLKVPNDPEAAQNRRIEILMRKARS